MLLGNYLRNAQSNQALGAVAWTPSATLELRLFSTALTAAGVGTELTNAGYERKTISNNTTNFPVTTTGVRSNAVQFDFAAAEEDWDGVTGDAIYSIGVFDTSGNLYFYQNYVDDMGDPDPRIVYDGALFKLEIGAMEITMTDI